MMKSIYFLFTLAILFASCNKKNAETVVEAPVVQAKSVMNANPVKSLVTESSLPDCLENSSDVKMVTDQMGSIVNVSNTLMISYGASNRINPCNLPEGFSEGDSVMFTGVIKEAPKGVRLAGTPFKLTFISKK